MSLDDLNDEPTHRYFEDADAERKRKPHPMLPRVIALGSSAIAVTCALIAMWLVKYDLIGLFVGLGLVAIGAVACIVARRADRSVALGPAIGAVLMLLAASLLLTNILIILLLPADSL